VILLLAATWPQRALVRAQLAADTGLQVVGTDSCESAVEWLRTAPFALVIVDTQRLLPEPQLLDALRLQHVPVLLLTNAFNQTEWTQAAGGLDVRGLLVRPVFIADLTRAAARLVGNTRAAQAVANRVGRRHSGMVPDV
jgi:DNA-binding NarL/FixJ family response regulator